MTQNPLRGLRVLRGEFRLVTVLPLRVLRGSIRSIMFSCSLRFSTLLNLCIAERKFWRLPLHWFCAD